MKKLIVFVMIISVMMLSCKKTENTATNFNNSIDDLFNFKNYQLAYEKKIDDSIAWLEYKNEKFSISGRFNYVKKYKSGWWKAFDEQNKEKYLDVEFFKEVDKNKLFNNQIITYKNNKIDTLNCKFYTREVKANDKVIYKFHFPKTSNAIYTSKINIGIISNQRPLLYPTDYQCNPKGDGLYEYNLDLSIYPNNPEINIIGLFSEYSVNKKGQSIAINEIFINDTVKVK